MGEFSGRICIVTGATRGIGRAISGALHEAGAIVIGFGRDEGAGRRLEQDLPGARFLAVDVADRTSVRSAVDETIASLGGVDHVVCSAGISRDALVLRLAEADWRRALDVNLSGTFHVVQAALRSLLRRTGSSVVAISSVIGETGNAGQAAYAASKAGLNGFCLSLAKEVASRGLRVNVLAPGLVETEMTEQLPAALRDAYLARIPLGRAASPREIANVALFLLSERASYITGQVIGVNGGLFP
ncbi:3-oxoacyl-ACP reductase FabG [Candidatus Uhrbacteria bacterium]|nr:3-oxoacyl-ACP reductase FabG [Candidatus Uhrbacteria bacterium]